MSTYRQILTAPGTPAQLDSTARMEARGVLRNKHARLIVPLSLVGKDEKRDGTANYRFAAQLVTFGTQTLEFALAQNVIRLKTQAASDVERFPVGPTGDKRVVHMSEADKALFSDGFTLTMQFGQNGQWYDVPENGKAGTREVGTSDPREHWNFALPNARIRTASGANVFTVSANARESELGAARTDTVIGILPASEPSPVPASPVPASNGAEPEPVK